HGRTPTPRSSAGGQAPSGTRRIPAVRRDHVAASFVPPTGITAQPKQQYPPVPCPPWHTLATQASMLIRNSHGGPYFTRCEFPNRLQLAASARGWRGCLANRGAMGRTVTLRYHHVLPESQRSNPANRQKYSDFFLDGKSAQSLTCHASGLDRKSVV